MYEDHEEELFWIRCRIWHDMHLSTHWSFWYGLSALVLDARPVTFYRAAEACEALHLALILDAGPDDFSRRRSKTLDMAKAYSGPRRSRPELLILDGGGQ